MSNVPVKEQLTNNDKKVLSSNAIRQLEVLSKYCDVDVEHNPNTDKSLVAE